MGGESTIGILRQASLNMNYVKKILISYNPTLFFLNENCYHYRSSIR